jgi:hypothetical protein
MGDFGIKTIGRRRVADRGLRDAEVLQRTMRLLRPTPALVPRGLFRFRTFEEADEWMKREMASTLARLRSRTSPGSAAPSTNEERATS